MAARLLVRPVDIAGHPKYASKRHYIDTGGREWMLQPAIQQQPDSCAYAAAAMHISYNLRIAYMNCTRMLLQPVGVLIDEKKWEKDITESENEKVRFIWFILEDALVNGVTLWNGLPITIDRRNHIRDVADDVMGNNIREILKFSTVLVVFDIHTDYSENGEQPYMGRGTLTYNIEGTAIQKHAVVIVGEYKDYSLFHADEVLEPLWVFQNSHGDPDSHFLGNGLNVIRHGLVKEIYNAEMYGASILLHPITVDLVKPNRQHRERVPLKRDAEDKDGEEEKDGEE